MIDYDFVIILGLLAFFGFVVTMYGLKREDDIRFGVYGFLLFVCTSIPFITILILDNI